MSDDLIEKIARAILETDPTCDYDACRHNYAYLPDGHLQKNWWESLHKSARAALSVMSKWQPIDTAPKDGTEIIIWDGSNIRIATFMYTDDDGQMKWFPDGMPFVVATHWMPLPSPPLPETEGKG